MPSPWFRAELCIGSECTGIRPVRSSNKHRRCQQRKALSNARPQPALSAFFANPVPKPDRLGMAPGSIAGGIRAAVLDRFRSRRKARLSMNPACSAGFPACGFTGLFESGGPGTGDWKVAEPAGSKACATNPPRFMVPMRGIRSAGCQPAACLFGRQVSPIANRRGVGTANGQRVGNPRYSAARPSRNQNKLTTDKHG